MSDILERIKWAIWKNRDEAVDDLAAIIVREIETTHRIIDPDNVTEEMLEACFCALPEHYDPPDMTRRPWHALKARRRFTAMAKTSKKVLDDDSK